MRSLIGVVLFLYLSSGLGTGEIQISSYIIGGSKADVKNFPFQAALLSNPDDMIKCGATIVTEMTLITAGHCIDKREPSQFYIKVGATSLEDKRGYRHEIDSWIPHEGFNRTHNFNEIAIIIIKDKFKLGPGIPVQPAKIYTGEIAIGTKVTVTGYGFTDYPKDNFVSAQLKKANVEIISNEECSKRFKNITVRKILDSHLCTISKSGKDGTCFYDSGGAMSWKRMLVGVIIFGVPCNQGYPDAYTKLASYADWIEDKIKTICKSRKCSKKHGHPVFVKE